MHMHKRARAQVGCFTISCYNRQHS
jgi:hypothetical protein